MAALEGAENGKSLSLNSVQTKCVDGIYRTLVCSGAHPALGPPWRPSRANPTLRGCELETCSASDTDTPEHAELEEMMGSIRKRKESVVLGIALVWFQDKKAPEAVFGTQALGAKPPQSCDSLIDAIKAAVPKSHPHPRLFVALIARRHPEAAQRQTMVWSLLPEEQCFVEDGLDKALSTSLRGQVSTLHAEFEHRLKNARNLQNRVEGLLCKCTDLVSLTSLAIRHAIVG